MKDKILLVGSQALRLHGVSTGRKMLDVDVIATADAFQEAVTANITRGCRIKNRVGTTAGGAVVWEGGVIWDCEFVDSPDVANDKATNITMQAGYNSSSLEIDSDIHGLECAVVPSLDFLYTLKMSHRFKKNSVHFVKTLDDILTMRDTTER